MKTELENKLLKEHMIREYGENYDPNHLKNLSILIHLLCNQANKYPHANKQEDKTFYFAGCIAGVKQLALMLSNDSELAKFIFNNVKNDVQVVQLCNRIDKDEYLDIV